MVKLFLIKGKGGFGNGKSRCIMAKLFCRKCGSVVKWEDLKMLELDKIVYHCSNKNCPFSVWEYRDSKDGIPFWTKLSLVQQKVSSI